MQLPLRLLGVAFVDRQPPEELGRSGFSLNVRSPGRAVRMGAGEPPGSATGPLTRKRMETVDEEVTAAALSFMDKAVREGKPFFVWSNSTRMHIFTHLKPSSAGKTGLGIYADGMVEHDAMVGQLLAKLKELGVEDNTVVMYSTDNGAETFT
jgi:arylsulfatase A-like enzyme